MDRPIIKRAVRLGVFAAMLVCTGYLAEIAGAAAAGFEFRALLLGALISAFVIGCLDG